MQRVTIAAMLACAALVAGCGDEDRSEGSKERFIADGDKLCSSIGESAQGRSRVANSPAGVLRNASFFRDLTRTLDAYLSTSAPDGDGAAKRIVQDIAQLASIARRQKVTAQRIVAEQRKGDAAAVQRLGRAFNRTASGRQSTIANRFDRRMRAYGFKNCGRKA